MVMLPTRYVRCSALAALTILSAGCSQSGADAHLYPISISGQKVVGNEAWVGVYNVWNEGDRLCPGDGGAQQRRRANSLGRQRRSLNS